MKVVTIVATCDFCWLNDEWPVDEPHDGWVQDEWPDGRIVDLCPKCAVAVLPVAVPTQEAKP